MLKQTTIIAIAIASGMTLMPGCADTTKQDQPTTEYDQTTPQPDQSAQPSQSTTLNQTALSDSEQQFVTKAALNGMAEVELGQVASQRASKNEVKQFAQRMVQDHTKANNELKQLAKEKGITLPSKIDEEHKAAQMKLSELSSKDFDQAYMKHMVEEHKKDISLFQREAQQGQDQDLKTWATNTLPTLQEHGQMARSVAGNIGATIN